MTMTSVAETQAQATRPRTEVSEQESFQLTRNLLRIAMSNISYVRGFFPENFYCEKFVPALEMKVNKLLPMDMESKRFIDWTEKGVFDALQKKYLRTLFLTICRGQDGPPIEEYTFSFKYTAEGETKDITSMTIGSSSGVPVYTDTSNQMSPLQMKQSASQMVRMLVQLMYTLDTVPKEGFRDFFGFSTYGQILLTKISGRFVITLVNNHQRTIFMRLHYYDDITPEDYEPPLFMSGTDDDPNPWDHEPFKMNVGHVDGRHYKLAIKVKTMLDPCDDWHDLAENETCSSDLMLTSDDDSSTSSEKVAAVNTPSSQLCNPLIQKVSPRMNTPMQAPQCEEQIQGGVVETAVAGLFKPMQSTAEEANNKGSDRTENPVFEVESLGRNGRLRKREQIAVDVIDITDKSSQLSKIEPECRLYQLEDGRWSNDTQQKNELKTRSLMNTKINMTSKPGKNKEDPVADNVKQLPYEKALLYTLPREHITMKQLQQVLIDVNPANLKKLMSQMCRDGYIEITPRARCKGRRVFHNPEADKKLQSLRAFFDSEMRGIEETKINKCAIRDLSQPWEGLDRRDRTCSTLPHAQKEQSKTLEDSVCGRKQALGSDNPRQGLQIQEEHPSAYNKHTKEKEILTLDESPLPQKAMQVLQMRVEQRKELIEDLEYDVNLMEETETMEAENPAENVANTFVRLQKKLDEKNEEVNRLRDWTFTQESELSEMIEDSMERAKASTLSEQPNLTPSLLGIKRKRVRFQDSDSPDDIYGDCTLHLKARKVDGPVDVAIYRSRFENARAEKYVGIARKGYDPYLFDTEGPEKILKRKYRGSSIPHHASIDSLKAARPKTDTYSNFNSFYESHVQAEALRFSQQGTALKKCPRPAVYARRSRAA